MLTPLGQATPRDGSVTLVKLASGLLVPKSMLGPLGIVNADVAAGAAIAESKLDVINRVALMGLYEVETIVAAEAMDGNIALTSGTIFGALALCLTAGTYSKIGFHHAATTPSALNDFRLGVHNPSTWARTTDTGDVHTDLSVSTVGTRREYTLATPVTLARGEFVGLSIGGSGTTMPQARGSGVAFALLDLTVRGGAYKRGRIVTGYTTGNLPTLTTAPTANGIPWIYLAP